ncbi:MAG: hypothetical protein AB1505_01325 [Candidatus Latescibacterota bacterium]
MPQQAKRLIIAFGFLLAVLAGVRHLLVPETFGALGHYRASAIDAVASQPLHYAGETACLDCHDDVAGVKGASHHAGVSCEVCHGPALPHVEDPAALLPPAPRDRGGCSLCHGYDPSRPTGFPQIDLVSHNPAEACIACHDPHAPEAAQQPTECAACHAQIVRTKAVSPHRSLECVRCHQTPAEHRDNPRYHRAGKPQTRELCGQCHDRQAEGGPAAAPRISMAEHEPGYVCWQCHYPHHPEAR